MSHTQEPRDLLSLASSSVDIQLSIQITTPRSLFGALDKAELDALMAPGVFTIITYVPLSNAETNKYILRSRNKREVKGQTTDEPSVKSRLVIQGHSGEAIIVISAPKPTPRNGPHTGPSCSV
ncbi:hypothetical protein E4U61_006427 [Claviceps capensis]|nr:hypothetical protein E4U61_006427 [Claviceps capensis]